MKKLALTLCLAALTTGAFAQGVVNFANATATAVSANGTLAAGANYYYGLFIAAPNTTDRALFTFTGNLATNINAGRFVNNAVQVPGWAPGENKAFYVAGWSTALGTDMNLIKQYVAGTAVAPAGAVFGQSVIAPSGTAGGSVGAQSFPPLNLFGGAQGIPSGFNMTELVVIPEPSSLALLGLGAAALLIRRRK